MKAAKTVGIYFFSILLAFIIFSCKKEKDPLAPVISLKTDAVYTQDKDTVAVGRSLRFGIQARGNDEVITNFVIKKVFPDESCTVVFDTGVYTDYLELDKVFFQNIEEEVEWTFEVTDKNRLNAQTSLTVYKDPNSEFGGIIHYPSVIMGYQGNTQYGHFLNLNNGRVYFEDSAQLLQEKIDMLTYYIVDDDLPSPVFSSPGEYDNYSSEAAEFYPSIPDWASRNYTLWDISVDDDPIPAEEFDNCHNDSLLIVSYDEVWGKKKFKWATTGRVIPFKTQAGKFGLIKVINHEETENGKIKFALKIQI